MNRRTTPPTSLLRRPARERGGYGRQHPSRWIVLGITTVSMIGTLLLMLPVARAGPGGAPWNVVAFTAGSAPTVTGLTLVVAGRMGLRTRLLAPAFNNGGFGLLPDSLAVFAADAVVLGGIGVAAFIGGLGYPVLAEVIRVRPRRRWSVHTVLTLRVSLLLLVLTAVVITVGEWHNPLTLGPMEGAGGIKVTTLAILVLAVVAEVRGHSDVNVHGRRLGQTRQAYRNPAARPIVG